MRQLTTTRYLDGEAEPVVDLSAINRLIQTCGDGGEEAVANLLETLFEETPRLLATLGRASADGDVEEVRRVSHMLKSHGLTFGLPGLAHVALELETKARHADLGGVDTLVGELGTEYERARPALDTLRRGLLEPLLTGLAA